MAQDYAASVQGVAIRVTALNADGSLASGASACYVTDAFMHVSFEPQLEAGDDIAEKNANGAVCIAYKAPDTMKNVKMEVAICEPDPELTAMLAGGTVLVSGGQSVGWASPSVGAEGIPNGCAIEVWSIAVANGARRPTNSYFRFVFPYVKLVPSGSRVIQTGALANVFSGTGLGNAGFGTGPKGDWAYISDRPYQYARDSAAPLGLKGYVSVP